MRVRAKAKGYYGQLRAIDDVFEVTDGLKASWFEEVEPEVATAAEAAKSPLDHDGDGKPGGSTAPEKTPLLKQLRKQFRDLFGKKPFSSWGEAELQAKIAEAARTIVRPAPDGVGAESAGADTLGDKP